MPAGEHHPQENEGQLFQGFIDIVDNADRMQALVDRAYPELHVYAIRFNLYQRLDYLLHVPIVHDDEKTIFSTQR